MNFNIFGGFQKNENFWGIMILWIFCGVHHNFGLYLGVISMHFMVFLRSRYRLGNMFLVAKIFQFFGVLEIPGIFWR